MKFILAIFILFPAISFAAGEELLWWVTNDSVSDIVPLYEGQQNPFPIVEEEVVVVKAKKVEKKVEEPKVERLGATLFAKIRQHLQSRDFIIPDIYTLKIKGFLEGELGPKVLIADTWYSVGDKISVPMEKLRSFNDLLNELAVVDDVLYNTINLEVKEKLGNFNNFTLKITKISTNSVKLSDRNGETYVISYITGGL